MTQMRKAGVTWSPRLSPIICISAAMTSIYPCGKNVAICKLLLMDSIFSDEKHADQHGNDLR